MPCYGCGTDYSTFKKEHGCKNCGMSFCMKCLPNKYPIARLNNEKHRVCNKCYNILTGKIKPEADKMKYSPPENYKKRIAALGEKGVKGHQGPSQGHGAGKAHPKHTSNPDLEIQQRLEKLREKTPSEKAAGQVSEKEIGERLAKMKGMDPSRYSSSNKPTNQRYYHPPDRRSQQEQMNDLLDEICHEVDLDASLPNPITEIENRLAQLKDRSSNPCQETDENNLNKASVQDSQTFPQNISNTSGEQGRPSQPKTDVTSPSSSSNNDTKPSNDNEDAPISPEEINKILSETAQELEEDAKKAIKGLEEDKEIMRKLQQMKQKRKESTTDINKDETTVETSDSENEDKLADEVIKQALEEAKLDEAVAKDGVNVDSLSTKSKKGSSKKEKLRNVEKKVKVNTEDEEWYDPDELPYCCICTEDAVLRCIGCERDLYCNKCFREAHKELGLDDHESIKYTPPKENT